jgi:tripartite-type tricarboxylate transporter receptor subunit TctC
MPATRPIVPGGIILAGGRELQKVFPSAIALATSAMLVWTSVADAQDASPTKPIHLLVGAEPGGTTDIVARVIGKSMAETLGQAIVVENRTGANQTIAAELTAKATPDGYTLLMVPAGFSINPALYKRLPYDPIKDFTPIAEVAMAPNVLVVSPSLSPRSVQQLIALAHDKPGSLSSGSSGIGSPSHLAGALFALMTKSELMHVPYKGSGPAMTDLLGGTIQLSFPSVPGALPFIASGTLVALGVTSSKRSSMLKDVPSIEEAGVPGYSVESWFGIAGPAGLPAQVVTRINSAVNQALKSSEVQQLLAREGAEPVGGSPADFSSTITTDIKKWTSVIADAHIERR